MFSTRSLIACFLENQGFKICALDSEEDLAIQSDIVVILALTPGASAEAIELAHEKGINGKLFVYIPKEYDQRYIFSLLKSKHAIINDDCVFPLEFFEKCDSTLCLKIWDKAISSSNVNKRKRRMGILNPPFE